MPIKVTDFTELVLKNQIEINMLRDEVQNIRQEMNSKFDSLRHDLLDRINVLVSVLSTSITVPQQEPVHSANSRDSNRYRLLTDNGILSNAQTAVSNGDYAVHQQNRQNMNATNQLPPVMQFQFQIQ